MKLRMSEERLAPLALVGATAALLLIWLQAVGLGAFVLDDGYIVEHAVAGLLAGAETRYADSTPWLGVTSPAHVGLVWLAAQILPLSWAQWAVSAAATLALVLGLHAVGRGCGLGPWLAAATAAAALLTGATLLQTQNGLETGLAMAAVAWTLAGLLRERPPLGLYALLAILPFIRPELAALTAGAGLWLLWRRPQGWILGAALGGGALAAAGGLLWLATGDLAPNTVSAKAYFFAEGCKPILEKLRRAGDALGDYAAFLGLALLGFALLAASPLRGVAAFFIGVFLLAYVWRFPSSLAHNAFRYLHLLIPFLVLGWAAALAAQEEKRRRIARILGLAAAAQIAFFAPERIRGFVEQTRFFSGAYAETAQWVAAHTPPDAVAMIHDAGKIARVGTQTLVDLVGLKSPASAEVHRRTTFAQCRQTPEAVVEIARESGATHLVTLDDWDKASNFSGALAAAGWSVERADSERGDSFYKVYRIAPPQEGIAPAAAGRAALRPSG